MAILASVDGAEGDEIIILSSGFDHCSNRLPHNKPVLEVVVYSNVKLIAKAILKAGSYSFQIGKVNSLTQETEWKQVYLGIHVS